VRKAYADYVLGKQTLGQLSKRYGKSVPTLQKYFEGLEVVPRILPAPTHPVSLVCDTTFFGRRYGVLVFRAQGKTLYWRFVTSESAAEVRTGMEDLLQAGWRFHGITVDGRTSIIRMLQTHYPQLPIQTCQFHVMQNVRQTLGTKPKTSFGKELLRLINELTIMQEQEFTDWLLYFILRKYRYELGLRKEADAKKAVTAIQQALPHLFTCRKYPERSIKNTTNACEGAFGQWKQKIKLHRGLKQHRQQKMISFLLAYQA
jgi:hypothetical protein